MGPPRATYTVSTVTMTIAAGRNHSIENGGDLYTTAASSNGVVCSLEPVLRGIGTQAQVKKKTTGIAIEVHISTLGKVEQGIRMTKRKRRMAKSTETR